MLESHIIQELHGDGKGSHVFFGCHYFLVFGGDGNDSSVIRLFVFLVRRTDWMDGMGR